MPDKIIFVLSDDYLAFIQSHFHTLEAKVSSHRISLVLLSASRCTSLLPDFQNNNEQYRKSLFITDEPALLRLLLQAGLYTIALYHENNKSCFFRVLFMP